MSDTTSRNPMYGPQLLADALLRTVGGATALFRVTSATADTSQSEVGLVATTFVDVTVSPVLMRRLLPGWKEGGESSWELMVSATGIEQQVRALDLPSVEALLQMTLAVTVAGKDYLIESIAANEAFGNVYLYRLRLRESVQQAV